MCDAPLVVDYYAVYGTTDVLVNDPKYCKTETNEYAEGNVELTGAALVEALPLEFLNSIPENVGIDKQKLKEEIAVCLADEVGTNSNEWDRKNFLEKTAGYGLGTADFVVGLIPWIGDGYDIWVAKEGFNYITQENLTCLDTVLRASFGVGGLAADTVGAAAGAGAGSLVTTIVTEIVQKGLGKTVKEAMQKLIKESSSAVTRKVVKVGLQIAGTSHSLKSYIGEVVVDLNSFEIKSIFKGGNKVFAKVSGKKVVKSSLQVLSEGYSWADIGTTVHIFKGMLNKIGDGVGGHGLRGLLEGDVIIDGIKSADGSLTKSCVGNIPDCVSFMKANPNVFFQGVNTKVLGTVKNTHTFFPAGWSEEIVMSKIDEMIKYAKDPINVNNLIQPERFSDGTLKAFTVNLGNTAPIRVVFDEINRSVVKSSYPKF